MHFSRVFLTGMLLVALASHSSADSFRVRSMTVVSLDIANPAPASVELGYNDAVGIVFPLDTRFLRGVEIEIRMPKEILEYSGSMAYGLYTQPAPAPAPGKIDYRADQLALQTLPSRIATVIQIPLQKNHRLKTSPYSTVLSAVVNPSSGPLVLRLLPVMKGLPENIENLIFHTRIKPLLADEGGFTLKLVYPGEEQSPVSIRVDETIYNIAEDMVILPPGTHQLSVVSEQYRSEVRMFTVEQARVTELEVALKDTTPLLFLAAPDTAEIFVDDVQIEDRTIPLQLSPGEHLVLFRIGDYELTRSVLAEKGHDYTVSMIVDIKVTESR